MNHHNQRKIMDCVLGLRWEGKLLIWTLPFCVQVVFYKQIWDLIYSVCFLRNVSTLTTWVDCVYWRSGRSFKTERNIILWRTLQQSSLLLWLSVWSATSSSCYLRSNIELFILSPAWSLILNVFSSFPHLNSDSIHSRPEASYWHGEKQGSPPSYLPLYSTLLYCKPTNLLSVLSVSCNGFLIVSAFNALNTAGEFRARSQ